jgi:hypothetical protein
MLIFVRFEKKHWQPAHYFLGDDITFESIGLTLPVADIYPRVINEDMGAWLESSQQPL